MGVAPAFPWERIDVLGGISSLSGWGLPARSAQSIRHINERPRHYQPPRAGRFTSESLRHGSGLWSRVPGLRQNLDNPTSRHAAPSCRPARITASATHTSTTGSTVASISPSFIHFRTAHLRPRQHLTNVTPNHSAPVSTSPNTVARFRSSRRALPRVRAVCVARRIQQSSALRRIA